MTKRTIVIVGGALSGPTAAARAREVDEHARILLIERNAHVSYAVGGLAYHLSGEVKAIADLDSQRADFFASVYGVEVWTGAEATALDAPARVLTVQRGGERTKVPYDALVFALGAASPVPDVPGLSGINVRTFRTLADLAALKKALVGSGRRVAVLGGGSMGVEAADGLVRAKAKVTLVERHQRLLPQLGTQVARAAEAVLAARARVILGAEVIGADGARGKVRRLHLSNGTKLEVDAVVIAAGLSPRTELLEAAGAVLAPDRTVLVDALARTSLPHVWACGVCVSVPSAVTGRPVWSAQGALADKTAQVAGANAAGAQVRLGAAAETMLVRVLDTVVGRTGLSAAQARAHVGVDAEVTTIHAPSHDPWFPGADDVLVELVWNRHSGRLLGAECAGRSGVDKRIDVAAAAIAGGLTVDQLAEVDLGYAPPFSAARDPINVAATVAAAHWREWVRSIGAEQLAKLAPTFQLVDVRGSKQHRAGTIAGAVHLPLEALRERVGELDRKRPTVAFCDSGRRGYLAARLLQQRGLTDVRYLGGGLASWQLVGQPLVRERAR